MKNFNLLTCCDAYPRYRLSTGSIVEICYLDQNLEFRKLLGVCISLKLGSSSIKILGKSGIVQLFFLHSPISSTWVMAGLKSKKYRT